MKNTCILTMTVLFLLLANPAKTQNQDDLTLWFGVSLNPASVQNIPLSLRVLPEYKGNSSVIIDELSYDMSVYVPFDFRFLISNNDNGINYGIGAQVIISADHWFIENRYEYGGTSMFRGVMMSGPISLTGLKPISPNLAINPNLFLDIPLSRNNATNSCVLHASVGYQAFTYVNGWETRFFNGNQILKYNAMKVLAYLIPVNIGVQLHSPGLSLEVGPEILCSFPTKIGRESGVKTSAIGLSLKLKMPEN